jgi:hypothetical protein
MAIGWSFPFIIAPLIGMQFYIISEHKVTRLLKKLPKYSSLLSNDEADGWIIGWPFIGYIFTTEKDGGKQIQLYLFTTKKYFAAKIKEISTNIDNEENNITRNNMIINQNISKIKILDREGTYSWFHYSKRITSEMQSFIARDSQQLIINNIMEYYKKNRNAVILLHGEKGIGKSMIPILLAKEFANLDINKKNQDKNKKCKQKQLIKDKKRIIKNEVELLNKIGKLPHELIDYIYLFVTPKIKYNLSYYFQLYKKYIIDYNLNHHDCIYKDFKKFEYCTYDKTSIPLQYMLKSIPINILQKYIYMGSPLKYFSIAFPEEGNICDYILLNYHLNKPVNEKYKDYIFEIIDLLSYFVTRTNEYSHSYENIECKKYYKFKEYELISKKIILSIIYLYNKYGNVLPISYYPIL